MRELAAGRYVLADRIATGGMGEVWRARDTALERDVAVKLLRPDIADDEAFRTRFATEARHAAALHDPSIATVFDYGDDVDGSGRHTTYLVMELVGGVPLSELLTAPMAPASAAHLIGQVADGLSVAHEAGIVHRDVKPANFIVTPDGRVKVTDFGIARARGAASVTDTGTIMGTPHYVAPEVAEGREATPASDIYSLGVVLYECLAGSRPFTGDTPIAVVMAHLRDTPPALPPSVPPALVALVTASMDKDPSHRPSSAAAFAASVRAAVDTTGAEAATVALAAAPVATQLLPSAPPAAGADAASSSSRRRSGWIPIVAVVLAVLLIAGLAYALLDDSEDRSPVADTSDTSTGSQTPRSSPPDTTTQPTEQTTTPAPTTPAPTTSAEQTPSGVLVDPADYIGAESKDAKKELEGLGLSVDEEEVEGGDKDIVADVSPSGEVAPESAVTLFVFAGEDEDED
ncbi:MAG: serine/threonine protein kinase, partial [Actinomycetota bacterium]|nr:serine/threonine protein kinase [Actinomycetota bacterium]